MSERPDLELNLRQLITEICSRSPNSLERQRGLNRLILLIQRSGKLYQNWQLPQGDYEDALQKTWLYFCRNLCEAATAKNGPYDSERSDIFTWINAYLKRRLQDAQYATWKEENIRVLPIKDEQGNVINPLDTVPSRIPTDDSSSRILEKIQQWLELNKKRLLRVHVRDRAESNAYILIERRLYPETTWQELAHEWQVSPSTIANFYQRRCLPLLQELRNEFSL
jgi:hypothetical protein